MKKDEMLRWTSAVLAIVMVFQVVMDLGRWLGDEPTPHLSAATILISAVLGGVLVYFIHKTSEFRGRTIVASLMVADIVVSSIFWSFDVSLDPALRTLTDALWLPGIALLYFGAKANELLYREDNFRM